jgi:hypothetical protein
LHDLSGQFKASYSVLLIKLLKLNLIDRKEFENAFRIYAGPKADQKGGRGDFYRSFLSGISNIYLSMVLQEVNRESITYYDALKFLGVSYKVMGELERKVQSAGESI